MSTAHNELLRHFTELQPSVHEADPTQATLDVSLHQHGTTITYDEHPESELFPHTRMNFRIAYNCTVPSPDIISDADQKKNPWLTWRVTTNRPHNQHGSPSRDDITAMSNCVLSQNTPDLNPVEGQDWDFDYAEAFLWGNADKIKARVIKGLEVCSDHTWKWIYTSTSQLPDYPPTLAVRLPDHDITFNTGKGIYSFHSGITLERSEVPENWSVTSRFIAFNDYFSPEDVTNLENEKLCHLGNVWANRAQEYLQHKFTLAENNLPSDEPDIVPEAFASLFPFVSQWHQCVSEALQQTQIPSNPAASDSQADLFRHLAYCSSNCPTYRYPQLRRLSAADFEQLTQHDDLEASSVRSADSDPIY